MIQTPALAAPPKPVANDSLAPKEVSPLPNRMLAEFRRHAPHYS